MFLNVNGDKVAVAANDSIEIFVTGWCPYCRALEKYLDSRGYPYKRYDIEKDSAGLKKHMQLGGGGVPVVVINGAVIRGFNPADIERNIRPSRNSRT